ncbi:MAG: beta-lactamase family protein [Oscillospiraceae bacterium]|nr:beta-lactamase family protein [Oscillospiraceae bacterium]
MKNRFYFRIAVMAVVLLTTLCACRVSDSALISQDSRIVEEESSALESSQEESSESEQEEENSEQSAVEEEIKKPINTISGNEAEINAAMDKIFEQFKVVGGSIAVFEKGEVVYLHHYGTANIEKEITVSDSTRFRIASVSKAVTALLAETLVDEQKLNIDDDICLTVNEKLRDPRYPNEPITTRQLLTHTSGLIDGGSYQTAIKEIPFKSLDELLDEGNIRSGAKPGTKYTYTNFGMGLVSGVIEGASGKRFYDYADEKLFAPLDMDAGYVVEKIDDRGQIATMYNLEREITAEPSGWKAMWQDYVNIPIGQMYLLGQGELYISARDLARIGCVMAGDGSVDGVSIISKERLDEMHTVYFTDEKTGVQRGLGVQAFDNIIEGKTLWGHQGTAYGMISGLIYDRKEECGFVVLTNSCYAAKRKNVFEINRAVIEEFQQYFYVNDEKTES